MLKILFLLVIVAAVSAILEPLTSALRATVEKLNPDLVRT
jgi:hypothetical protein